MGKIKQINIKNGTYCFYNDRIYLKYFDTSLLKVDKKHYKEIDSYHIGYVAVKKIANCNNIKSVNILYLMINGMIGHFKKKNGNKYLVLDDVDKNKEVSKQCEEVWEGIKKKVKPLIVAKKLNMEKI